MSELDVRCSVLSELATRYVEGALPPNQLLSYETHLVFCTSCKAFLADLRNVRKRLRELPLDAVDADEKRQIVQSTGGE